MRPGLGEFWPEDIDTSLCDVVYYSFGNVLNNMYTNFAHGTPGSTWVRHTLVRHRSRTVSKNGMEMFGHQAASQREVLTIAN